MKVQLTFDNSLAKLTTYSISFLVSESASILGALLYLSRSML